MRKHFGVTVVMSAAFGLMTMSHPARAQGDGACREDVKKLCGDVKPGGGAIRDCMNKNEAKLSKACKDDRARAKENREAFEAACKPDLQKYCANVTPGEGRDMACLKAYSDKISAACKEKLPHWGMHKGMHKHGGAVEDDHESAAPPAKK